MAPRYFMVDGVPSFNFPVDFSDTVRIYELKGKRIDKVKKKKKWWDFLTTKKFFSV
jgi:hypothetical protein